MADHRNWLIDHTGVGVSDIHRSARFYEAALRPLSMKIVMRISREFKPVDPVDAESSDLGGVAYGIDYPTFWIDVFHPHGVKQHTAFRAQSRQQVDAFHEAALLVGGIDNGQPGLRSGGYPPGTMPHSFSIQTVTTSKSCSEKNRPRVFDVATTYLTWMKPKNSARVVALSMLGLLMASGCSTEPVRSVRRVEFVRTLFKDRDHVADFRNMKAYFPTTVVRASGSPNELAQGQQVDLPTAFYFRGTRIDTASFLELTDTTGLIVVKDDKVVFEHYYRGTDAHTRTVAWSLSKSFVSALVGIAVAEGKIHSISDPVTQYVPELAGSAYDGVSIKDVLQMSSGARWNEDYSDSHSDVMRFGRAVAFGRPLDAFAATLPRAHAPGTYQHYNSMDTQVLGMVLRHATGTSLATYLSTRIWQPVGMQDDAYYLTDRSGVEFAAGGLNATLRDYARGGLLYAHYGNWHGTQIIPAEWVRSSVTPDSPHLMPGKRSSSDEIWGYGYQWWVPDLQGDYVAEGIFNQFIYVNPRERLVIVKSSANHTYGTGHGDDESKDHESAHIALFKAIETALSKQPGAAP